MVMEKCMVVLYCMIYNLEEEMFAHSREEGRPMMVKRKLDGEMDKSLAD